MEPICFFRLQDKLMDRPGVLRGYRRVKMPFLNFFELVDNCKHQKDKPKPFYEWHSYRNAQIKLSKYYLLGSHAYQLVESHEDDG